MIRYITLTNKYLHKRYERSCIYNKNKGPPLLFLRGSALPLVPPEGSLPALAPQRLSSAWRSKKGFSGSPREASRCHQERGTSKRSRQHPGRPSGAPGGTLGDVLILVEAPREAKIIPAGLRAPNPSEPPKPCRGAASTVLKRPAPGGTWSWRPPGGFLKNPFWSARRSRGSGAPTRARIPPGAQGRGSTKLLN